MSTLHDMILEQDVVAEDELSGKPTDTMTASGSRSPLNSPEHVSSSDSYGGPKHQYAHPPLSLPKVGR